MTHDPNLPTLGIDPGARNTGMLLLQTDGTFTFTTITNAGSMLPPDPTYLRDLTTAAHHLTEGVEAFNVHVESVNRPSWHMNSKASYGAASNPEPLLSTATVLGVILGIFPHAEIVPPAKNGSRGLGTYPDALVSDRERKQAGWQLSKGERGVLRHVRSAYDIATYPGPYGDNIEKEHATMRVGNGKALPRNQAVKHAINQATGSGPTIRRIDARKGKKA